MPTVRRQESCGSWAPIQPLDAERPIPPAWGAVGDAEARRWAALAPARLRWPKSIAIDIAATPVARETVRHCPTARPLRECPFFAIPSNHRLAFPSQPCGAQYWLATHRWGHEERRPPPLDLDAALATNGRRRCLVPIQNHPSRKWVPPRLCAFDQARGPVNTERPLHLQKSRSTGSQSPAVCLQRIPAFLQMSGCPTMWHSFDRPRGRIHDGVAKPSTFRLANCRQRRPFPSFEDGH